MSLSLISTFQTEDKLIPPRLMMVEIIIEAEYVLARPLLPPPLTSHPPSTSTCPLPSPSNRKWQVQTDWVHYADAGNFAKVTSRGKKREKFIFKILQLHIFPDWNGPITDNFLK